MNKLTDEINNLSGITSNIQEQLDSKGTSNVSVISDLGDGSVNSENSTVYIGYKPSESNSGSYNSVVSTNGLSSNTTGSFNQAFGYNALNKNTTGNRNIAIGAESLSNNSEANDNIAIGYSYDYSIGNTTFKYNGGSHEIMLRYDFMFKKKDIIKSPRYF